MSFSNSVVRRYTPPTCTLEINAAGSPLSRWIGRPALKQLEFQLSLDDPRLPEEKRLTLKGDKTQLEALREAVETYVQDLLVQSPDISPTLLPAAAEAADELPAEAVSDAANDETTAISPTNSDDAQSIESVEAEQAASPHTSLSALPGNIYLQPDGMLAHHLYLGSLATPESGQVVSLSTLQLFDLATAFEQYAEELVALPHLKREQKKGFATRLKTTPVWARTAAVLVLAGGATAAGLLFVNRNTLIQMADAPPASPTPTPTEQPPIAVIPSPSPTLVVPTPPLSSSQILPSPTVGTGASPSPNTLPSVLPGVTPGSTLSPNLGNNMPSSRSGVPAAPSPNASPSVPSGGATAAGRSPNESYKVPGLQFGTRRPTTPATFPPTPSPQQRNDSTERSRTVPSGESRTVPSGESRRVPSGESRPSPSPAATSTPDSVATRPNRAVQRNEPRATRSTPPANPSFFPRPDVTPKATTSPARGPAPIPAPTIVRPAAIPTPRFETPTPIPTPPGATPTAIPTPMPAAPAQIPRPTATATIPDPTVAALRQTPTPKPEPNSSPTPTPAPDSTSAVFDPIPQVAEVRRYFQQRWQPPSTLTQDIEYTLSLNPDGSIKSVTPRGQTAEIYLDRTEMPLVGEPFVSPIEGGRNTTIILVLSKDGKVQAFLGSSN